MIRSPYLSAQPPSRRLSTRPVLLAVLLALALPAEAYIGPGAGFALLSSFMVVFTTIVLAIFAVLLWPFRKLWRVVKRGRRPKPWYAS